MTITYTGRVANARLCAFSCLLFHWKGSIYKLMYKEMAVFCTLYATISAIYRLVLDTEQRRTFEKISLYCETFINLIPLSFVLGFYIAMVVTRWWNQYTSIPWPDRVMVYASTMIEGNDEHGRLIRRTLMRYLTLGSLIVFQATSVRVKKRFPTFDHLIEAGIASRAEIQALDDVSTPHGKWWIPFVWSCNLVKQARQQGRIADNYLLKSLIDEISAYRGSLGMLYSYDWISVPLVYTQVATLAVYTFFLSCIFGRQYLDPAQNYAGHHIDLYIPFFTLLQFFFYMGWLKVAEQLINPFGEDDDDFEMNWIIDRNMQVSLLTADDLYGQIPPIEKDPYYGEPPPDYLPYTKSSIKGMSQPHMGSTIDIRVSDEGMKVLSPLETIQECMALRNPNHLSSYLNTTRRNTPMASPHLGHCHNQNFMSGMLSPSDVLSRASLHSCEKDVEEGQTPANSHSTLNRVMEKLGKKFTGDHSSRNDLSCNLHSAFVGIFSKQTSANDDADCNINISSGLTLGEHAVVDSKISNPSVATTMKLSPVTEDCPYTESSQAGDEALIELSEQLNSDINCEQEQKEVPIMDRDVQENEIGLIQLQDHSGAPGADHNITVNSNIGQVSVIQPSEDLLLVQENSVELNGFVSGQLQDGQNEFPCKPVEKFFPRSRLTVQPVPEGSWTQGYTSRKPGREEMNYASLTPSIPHVRIANIDKSSQIRAPFEGKLLVDDGPSLEWVPQTDSRPTKETEISNIPDHLRDRHRSESSAEYEMPESNQCSISSITPLLTSDSSRNFKIHELNANEENRAGSAKVNVTSAF